MEEWVREYVAPMCAEMCTRKYGIKIPPRPGTDPEFDACVRRCIEEAKSQYVYHYYGFGSVYV